MNISLEAWGGGLIVILAALLWMVYFMPTLIRKHNEYGDNSQQKQDLRLAREELKRMRAEEQAAARLWKEARSAAKAELRDPALSPQSPAVCVAPVIASANMRIVRSRVIFRRLVGLAVLLSALGIMASSLMMALPSIPITSAPLLGFTAIFLLSLFVNAALIRAARKRYNVAPTPAERRQAPRFQPERLENNEQAPSRGWLPTALPKPIYVSDRSGDGRSPRGHRNQPPTAEAEVRAAQRQLQQEARAASSRKRQQEQKKLAQAVPLNPAAPARQRPSQQAFVVSSATVKESLGPEADWRTVTLPAGDSVALPEEAGAGGFSSMGVVDPAQSELVDLNAAFRRRTAS